MHPGLNTDLNRIVFSGMERGCDGLFRSIFIVYYISYCTEGRGRDEYPATPPGGEGSYFPRLRILPADIDGGRRWG